MELKGVKNLHSDIIKQSALQMHTALHTLCFVAPNVKGTRLWRPSHTLEPRREKDADGICFFDGPTFANTHVSWLTLHIPFKYLWNPSLLQVFTQQLKGWGRLQGVCGGGAKKNNYSCLTFPLCFSMLSSFTSFHSLKKQKMVLRPILKSLICVFYVTYCDMNQIITMAALSLVIIVEVF